MPNFGFTTAQLLSVNVAYVFKTVRTVAYAADAEATKRITKQVVTYLGYNSRHKPVLSVTADSNLNSSGYILEDTMQIVFTPYSWDCVIASAPYIAESTLINRPLSYLYADFNVATATFTVNKNSAGSYIIDQAILEITEYNDYGKLWTKTKYTKMSDAFHLWTLDWMGYESSGWLWSLERLNIADTYNYKNGGGYFSLSTAYDGLILNNQSIKYHYELTADKYYSQEYVSAPNNREVMILNTDGFEVVFAPIPVIQKTQALDTDQWNKFSFDDTYMAAYNRSTQSILNNTYVDLSQQSKIGLQQIYAAYEAAFIYDWNKVNSYNFEDVRTIKSTLLSRLNVVAALICNALKIRFRYMDYVLAILNLVEELRGVNTTIVNNALNYAKSGVHSSYPKFNLIVAAYKDVVYYATNDVILQVFEIIAIELSTNDTPENLFNLYTAEISKYNRFMAAPTGSLVTAAPEIKKLGNELTNSARIMSELFRFKLLKLWSAIDKSLASAYMGDGMVAGSLNLADSSAAPAPGDDILVDFIDTERIPMKAMGLSYTVNETGVSISLQTKRPLSIARD